ncbi:hypothetical protein KPL47_18865 [Clostridium estertheticum]|uniref:hypothetical protein n=1 Tax=Clostridium estertheticum TaxID=238834 RepID=UPI001C0B9361|nr:hypothetical protein [Clostridium estertheticum]MBU3178390.1 hypothetical protein [Clostridium estertheticum]
MQIIIGIVVILFVIGIIGNILKWAKENIIPILLIIGAIVIIYVFGFWAVLKVAVVICGILGLGGWIYNCIAEKNEKQLNSFLRNSCMQMGCMDVAAWVKKLPQFAGKSYNSSFGSITSEFALAMEKKYITDDPKLSWLDPATNYLKKAFAADVWELERIPSKILEYTHCTSNGKLIQEAMEQISDNKIINGKHLVQKASLEAEAVCKDHYFNSIESVPDYYLYLYTINEYFRERSVSKDESNMETEEMSLDDL